MAERESLVTIEVDDETLEEASRIAEYFGLDLPLVTRAFYKQIVREGRIPLNLSDPEPNDESLEARREARDIVNGKIRAGSYDSPATMFAAFDRQEHAKTSPTAAPPSGSRCRNA